ncbi:uncharacterized protein LOC34622821 [Cyclospora cayetanensis]|uniref:Uncharacterized protein LOC34622821 n=1 Tax=Cyclospora cayetanensis TaxID=88456 RepID=A0A6P6RXV2_9EIME|nr:uncharacterized protein LOC34622821 [Cyclospora cayetanensis]
MPGAESLGATSVCHRSGRIRKSNTSMAAVATAACIEDSFALGESRVSFSPTGYSKRSARSKPVSPQTAATAKGDEWISRYSSSAMRTALRKRGSCCFVSPPAGDTEDMDGGAVTAAALPPSPPAAYSNGEKQRCSSSILTHGCMQTAAFSGQQHQQRNRQPSLAAAEEQQLLLPIPARRGAAVLQFAEWGWPREVLSHQEQQHAGAVDAKATTDSPMSPCRGISKHVSFGSPLVVQVYEYSSPDGSGGAGSAGSPPALPEFSSTVQQQWSPRMLSAAKECDSLSFSALPEQQQRQPRRQACQWSPGAGASDSDGCSENSMYRSLEGGESPSGGRTCRHADRPSTCAGGVSVTAFVTSPASTPLSFTERSLAAGRATTAAIAAVMETGVRDDMPDEALDSEASASTSTQSNKTFISTNNILRQQQDCFPPVAASSAAALAPATTAVAE